MVGSAINNLCLIGAVVFAIFCLASWRGYPIFVSYDQKAGKEIHEPANHMPEKADPSIDTPAKADPIHVAEAPRNENGQTHQLLKLAIKHGMDDVAQLYQPQYFVGYESIVATRLLNGMRYLQKISIKNALL